MAAQLPQELGYYLRQTETDEAFGLDEFLERVGRRQKVDPPTAAHHVRVVFSVLEEAVSASEMEHVRAQLPEEFATLFEAGSEGAM